MGLFSELVVAAAGSVPSAVADYVVAREFSDGLGGHRTVFEITALPISTVDNGTAGHAGSAKIYDFPKGYIHIIRGVMKNTLLTADGTGLPNDSEIDIAVGSVAATTDEGALSGTHEDILNKDDITLSSAVTATNQTQAEVTGGGLDGTSTAKDAYLNVAVSAATADADGTLTVTGKYIIEWTNLGFAGE